MSLKSIQLAILGGEPAFSEALHVGRPNIGDRARLAERLDAALDRRWLTNNGPLVQEFEQVMQERLGVRHCIATCNATSGLVLAIRAAGLHSAKGSEVIVPAFTFAATAHALSWQGITPVFCDIDPLTHTIDPACAEALITPRTTGILGVHLWGRPCDVNALETLAAGHGLTLLFDAAHAIDSHHDGHPLGGAGRAEVFSFHATKVVNAFEGGMIATNDDAMAGQARLTINFGFTGMDQVETLGINAKMNEAQAAMGLTSLEAMDDFIAVNRANHAAYARVLDELPGLSLMHYPEAEHNSHHYVVAEVHEDVAGLSRDRLIDVLHAENVRARRYFYPGCHRLEPYASEARTWRLPETEQLCERVLCLPTGTAVTEADIAVIGDILASALRQADQIPV